MPPMSARHACRRHSFLRSPARREAHHWAHRYPAADDTAADGLTALCSICHEIATTMRQFEGVVFMTGSEILDWYNSEADGAA